MGKNDSDYYAFEVHQVLHSTEDCQSKLGDLIRFQLEQYTISGHAAMTGGCGGSSQLHLPSAWNSVTRDQGLHIKSLAILEI